MTPHEFLVEEFKNVRRALDETLRYDYGPEQGSKDYYKECDLRLKEIDKLIVGVNKTDYPKIHAHIGELSTLTLLISLIERSRLGEFSWPFSEELRQSNYSTHPIDSSATFNRPHIWRKSLH